MYLIVLNGQECQVDSRCRLCEELCSNERKTSMPFEYVCECLRLCVCVSVCVIVHDQQLIMSGVWTLKTGDGVAGPSLVRSFGRCGRCRVSDPLGWAPSLSLSLSSQYDQDRVKGANKLARDHYRRHHVLLVLWCDALCCVCVRACIMLSHCRRCVSVQDLYIPYCWRHCCRHRHHHHRVLSSQCPLVTSLP